MVKCIKLAILTIFKYVVSSVVLGAFVLLCYHTPTHRQNSFLCIELKLYPFSFPSALGNHHAIYLMNLTTIGITYLRGIMQYLPFYVLLISLGTISQGSFIITLVRIFHCVYMPHSVYPFFHSWVLELLPFGYCE